MMTPSCLWHDCLDQQPIRIRRVLLFCGTLCFLGFYKQTALWVACIPLTGRPPTGKSPTGKSPTGKGHQPATNRQKSPTGKSRRPAKVQTGQCPTGQCRNRQKSNRQKSGGQKSNRQMSTGKCRSTKKSKWLTSGIYEQWISFQFKISIVDNGLSYIIVSLFRATSGRRG